MKDDFLGTIFSLAIDTLFYDTKKIFLTTTKFPLDCLQGQSISLSKNFYLIIARHEISNISLKKFSNFFRTKGKE